MILALIAGCKEPVDELPPEASPGRPGRDPGMQESPGIDAEAEFLVAFLGDSLSAGLGVEEEQSFPRIVEARLLDLGWSVEVLNAGISGDTTAGGVSRLKWILRQDPQIVVVELGANDGLRGLSIERTEANLRQIISAAEEAGARVLLAGMMVPPNYGADYSERFNAVYPSLADELGVPLVPFLLEGVAAEPDLNQADGIHPNSAGHLRVAENVVPYLEVILEELAVRPSPPGS